MQAVKNKLKSTGLADRCMHLSAEEHGTGACTVSHARVCTYRRTHTHAHTHTHTRTHTHTHTHTHTRTRTHYLVRSLARSLTYPHRMAQAGNDLQRERERVCVCVCDREREREREIERQRERKRE